MQFKKEKETECYTFSLALIIVALITILSNNIYYNSPKDEFECLITDTENKSNRISFTIIKTSDNTTYPTSEYCNNICDEVFEDFSNQTDCVERRYIIGFNKPIYTRKDIIVYKGDIWINIICIILIILAIIFSIINYIVFGFEK